MQIEPTSLPGVLVLTPRRHGDTRGFFAETLNRDALAESGLDLPELVEESAWEVAPGAASALHYQAPPRARAGLLRCAAGAARITVLDARRGADSFGHSATIPISADDGRQVWLPAGRPFGWTAGPDGCTILLAASDSLVPDLAGQIAADALAGWQTPFTTEACP